MRCATIRTILRDNVQLRTRDFVHFPIPLLQASLDAFQSYFREAEKER